MRNSSSSHRFATSQRRFESRGYLVGQLGLTVTNWVLAKEKKKFQWNVYQECD